MVGYRTKNMYYLAISSNLSVLIGLKLNLSFTKVCKTVKVQKFLNAHLINIEYTVILNYTLNDIVDIGDNNEFCTESK